MDFRSRSIEGKEAHFTYFNLDRSSGRLILSAPVWDGIEISGYVLAEFDYELFTGQVADIRFGDSGEAMLADAKGNPLSGKMRSFLGTPLVRQLTSGAVAAKDTAQQAGPRWVALPGDSGWPLWRRLVCDAPLNRINSLRAQFNLPSWSLVVTQSPDESYVALRNSLEFFVLAGFIGILVVGSGGAVIAWHIASPLKALQEGVKRFARGDRKPLAEVHGSDEIAELADEFNRMAKRVTASENELRAFAQAVEDAGDAIIMTDPKGVIYYANPAFEIVTGYSPEEVKGRTPSFLGSEITGREVYEDMWRAIDEGRHWRGELWNKRKNGKTYPIDLTVSPIRDEKGNVVSLLGVHRDITLAREYQDSLESEVEARTREIAETEGLTVMGRMASMIAHDLRNSLSTVKMNFQILFRKHNADEDEEKEHCRMGLDQVEYMEEILRDMLSYARPERLRADYHDITPIINDALVADSHLIKEGGIEVFKDIGKGLPKVYCDRVKVTEVLRNLIENAVNAMPEGGDLEVGAKLMVEIAEPSVRIIVGDSGAGIPVDVQPMIFEPFFTTRTKGSGLGLAIAKRIVDQHGGQIEIDASTAMGTTISFTLPTVPAEM